MIGKVFTHLHVLVVFTSPTLNVFFYLFLFSSPNFLQTLLLCPLLLRLLLPWILVWLLLLSNIGTTVFRLLHTIRYHFIVNVYFELLFLWLVFVNLLGSEIFQFTSLILWVLLQINISRFLLPYILCFSILYGSLTFDWHLLFAFGIDSPRHVDCYRK